MKFTSSNTIIFTSEADYEHKLFEREMRELEAEFERIMLIEQLAEWYTAKQPKK